jgi:ribosomal protein S6
MAEKQATKTEEIVAEKQAYELYLMVKPTASEQELENIRQAIVGALEKRHGMVQRADQFKKEQLAQPVRKIGFAYISTISFWIDAQSATLLEEDLKVVEGDIMRWLITKDLPKKAESTKPARVRKPRVEVASPVATATPEAPKKEAAASAMKEEEQVTLDDIDKKLDEIMGNL